MLVKSLFGKGIKGSVFPQYNDDKGETHDGEAFLIMVATIGIL